MQFGASLINRGPMATPDNMVRFAQRAEALGFVSLTISDHIVVPKAMPANYPYHPDGEFAWQAARDYYEPLATLMFLAGKTSTIRLGTSVLIVPYRNPVTTAKMLATVDALSGGRVFLGIGTGWWEDEFKALGIAGHFAQRGPRTDEYLRIYKALWLEENPAFQGEFFSFADLEFSPKPAQAGGIPIWVGGHTRRALRRTVELGDAWHPIGLRPPAGLEPAKMGEQVALLGSLAEKAGRDPAAIQVAFRAPVAIADGERRTLTGSAAQVIEDVQAYAAQGVTHLTVDLTQPAMEQNLEQLQRISEEVAPHCR